MKTSLVIEQVAVLALLMAVGYIATKKDIINEEISKGMAMILTAIALPALIISSFDVGFSKDTLRAVLLMLAYSVGAHLIAILISKIFFARYSKGENAVLSFGTIIPNSGFMGLPLIFVLFGQEAVLYSSIAMIPYHAFLWTYGEGILSKEKPESPIKNLVSNPAVIAVIIGILIFIFNIQMPYVVSRPISLLAALTSPLSMLILGEKITKLKFGEMFLDKDVYFGCFARLIVAPLVTLAILKVINAPELLRNIVVTMQSLPTAILLVVLTQKHGGEIELASKFTVVSHILSILTIPIISIFM